MSPNKHEADVVVIGAGISGLTAARRLKQIDVDLKVKSTRAKVFHAYDLA